MTRAGRWILNSNALAPMLRLGALAVVALVAARPLWSSLSFFDSDDGVLHLLRVYALDRAIRQGVPYPRWIMDLAFGYGYPVFNFYPPLAEFLTESIHLLGFDLVSAFKGTCLIAIVVATLGAYLLGRDLDRETRSFVSGALTAAAYVFFPYFLSDIFARGADAEALAAAILPWAVWLIRRVVRMSSVSAVLLLALSLAAMLLAHSLTMLMVAPALIGYFLLEWRQSVVKDRRRALIRATGAGVLSLGLAGFYWLPFIADLSTVRMGQGIRAIQDALQSNFLSLDQLVQFDFFYRYSLPLPSLSLVVVSLALLAIVFAIAARSRERAVVIFFGALAGVSAFLMLEQTNGLWLAVPFATMIQYPWRVSILVGLGAAILIGLLPQSVSELFLSQSHRQWARNSVAVIAGIALAWSATGRLALRPLYIPMDSPTLGQLAHTEAYTGSIGTTTWGEYMPVGVQPLNLLRFRAGDMPPSAAEIRLLEYSPYYRTLTASASAPFTLTFRTLYNSAWRVRVDGGNASAFSNTPMSLVAATVPAGNHKIQFDLQEGLAQTVGFLITVLSLATLLALIVLCRHESQARWVLTVATCCIGVFAVPAFFATAARPQDLQPFQLSVAPSAELIGLRIENARLEDESWRVNQASPSLHLTAFWQSKRLLQDLPIVWRLVDASNSVLARAVQLPRYGTGIAAGWVPDEIIQDEYDLPLQGIAAGRYMVQVSWGAKDFDDVSTLVLEHAAPSPAASIQNRVSARVGDQIRLLGYNAPPFAQPGGRLPVEIFWQAEKNVTADYTTFVQLLDARGNAVARSQVDTPPGGGLAFTSLWNPGEIITDRTEIDLPSNLQPGEYRLIAGLYHYPELDRLSVLSEDGKPTDDYVVLGQVQISR